LNRPSRGRQSSISDLRRRAWPDGIYAILREISDGVPDPRHFAAAPLTSVDRKNEMTRVNSPSTPESLQKRISRGCWDAGLIDPDRGDCNDYAVTSVTSRDARLARARIAAQRGRDREPASSSVVVRTRDAVLCLITNDRLCRGSKRPTDGSGSRCRARQVWTTVANRSA